MNTEGPVRRLLGEIDRYLATLGGPGVDAVRSGLAAHAQGPVRPRLPQQKDCLRHLAPALRQLAESGHQPLADAIADASPHLRWVIYDAYGTERIGTPFAEGHAFASLVGEYGPVAADDYDLGLFLIAPNTFYRDHFHPAPELYAPLTGPHGWRFQPGAPFTWLEAHHPVWNEPMQPHATVTGDNPFLCIFGWTRDVSLPADILPSADWPAIDESLAARKSLAVATD